MRVGDFQIVAKHFRVADFDAGDSSGVTNRLLVVCNPLLSASSELAKFIEFRVVAVLNKIAVPNMRRAGFNQGFVKFGAKFGTQIEFRFKTVEQFAFAFG